MSVAWASKRALIGNTQLTNRLLMQYRTLIGIAVFIAGGAALRAGGTITIGSQPANQTAAVGAKVEFYVGASTSTSNALTYQWYKKTAGGASGATGGNRATNSIASATADDEASYWVVITDVTSTNTSATNKVTVVAAPTISTQLANKDLALGSNYNITVVCSNRLGGYFWYFNTNHLLSGGATNSYPIRDAKSGDAGAYTLVASNIAGAATSAPALLTIWKYPVITNPVVSSNVVPAGANVTNSAGVDGTGLCYQWYFGKAAAASTSNTLILNSVTTNNNGVYVVVASNAVGKVTSGKWVLTVIPPPAITTQPKAASLTNGQKLSLTVKASGVKPYTNLVYQWTTNGIGITGCTNAALVISNIGPSRAGAYAVVITNFGGAVTSTPVTVAVGEDVTPPTLKITDPAKTNSATTNAIYTFKGAAADDISVTNVAFSLDGIHFTNATSTNPWAKWSADVPLAVGSNSVWVVARDYSGNATTNQVRLFYAKWYSLTLTNAGTGGALYGGASNAVQYGSNYAVTAKAAAHSLFVKWAGWSGVTLSTNGTTNTWKAAASTIQFRVTNNVVLTSEVDFNRFWDCAGTYYGLFYHSKAYSHTNCGFITTTITTNLAYSSKVVLGGQTISLSGQLDTNGDATFSMPWGGDMTCHLRDTDFYGIWGAGDAEMGSMDSYRGYFSKSNPATNYAGTFTIAIAPPGYAASGSSIGGATHGFGYGTVSVSTNGTVAFAGVTADGQVMTQSVPLNLYGEWPVFSQLYPLNKTNAAGELFGRLWLYDRSSREYRCTHEAGLGLTGNYPPVGDVVWIKARNPAGLTNYTAGLTNVTCIQGSVFAAPASGAAPVLTNFMFGTLSFTGGGLTNPITTYVFMAEDGTMYSYDSDISLKLARTGLMSGKFPYNGNIKTPTAFSGVVFQQTNSWSDWSAEDLKMCSELVKQTNTAVGAFSGPDGTTGSVVLAPASYH